MIITSDIVYSDKEVVNVGTENRDVIDNDVYSVLLNADNNNVLDQLNAPEEILNIEDSNTVTNSLTDREHAPFSNNLRIKMEDVDSNEQVPDLFNQLMSISNRLGELGALRTMFRLLGKAGVGTTREASRICILSSAPPQSWCRWT